MLLQMDVRDIPQIGFRTAMELKTVFDTPIETVVQLREISVSDLQLKFGEKRGQTLHGYAFGVDHRKVENVPRQHISVEMSFGVRTKTFADVERWVGDLATEAFGRMQEAGFRAGKATLKIYKAKEDQFLKGFVPWKVNGTEEERSGKRHHPTGIYHFCLRRRTDAET